MTEKGIEFDTPNSENAAALQNMLGATNELKEPISRNAKILHNILGEQHEIEEPVGNIGKLLKQILEQGTGGGAYDGVAVIPIQSIAEALPTNTTVTIQ